MHNSHMKAIKTSLWGVHDQGKKTVGAAVTGISVLRDMDEQGSDMHLHMSVLCRKTTPWNLLWEFFFFGKSNMVAYQILLRSICLGSWIVDFGAGDDVWLDHVPFGQVGKAIGTSLGKPQIQSKYTLNTLISPYYTYCSSFKTYFCYFSLHFTEWGKPGLLTTG